ncbi:MAG: cation diffusion facilitator family transporter [Thermoleophilaceae bacterium]
MPSDRAAGAENDRMKTRAAALSIASNTALIALKVFAGIVTGSVAILTEAAHSAIDLLASMIAFVSLRKAAEPADESHPYGHAKLENLAAAIEGMLILVGAGVIAYESIHRLVEGAHVESLGFGIAVIGLSAVVNLGVSEFLYRKAALTDSPALAGDAAHLRTDAYTSLGVLAGLTLVAITGVDALDSVTALVVAVAIVASGVRLVTSSSRVLVDEALPQDELDQVREVIRAHAGSEVLGFHALRARRAGSRRYVDMHVQFRDGTSLERAHELAHQLQAEIRSRLRGADVLIHLEPESALRQVDRGGKPDGQDDAEVADVAVDQQQNSRQ